MPEGGALLWIDNMLIPANSANPQGAYQLMDYVYQPEIAQLITEWVLYMSPVPAVQELIAHARRARRAARYADELQRDGRERVPVARRRAARARPRSVATSTTDEEREEWDDDLPPDLGELIGGAGRRSRDATAGGRDRGRQGGEPPKRADQSLAKRQRRVAYGLLAPGGIYLALAFIVPVDPGPVHVAAERRPAVGRVHVHLGVRELRRRLHVVRGRSSCGRCVYSGLATLHRILLAYPMAYWIAFYGGKWKSTLFFLILVPFFVSFVIRTVQWKFILADDGLLFAPLKSIGLLPDDFRVLATPVAVVAGITYNFLPFTALPLYVALERIDKRLVEAAKDLYATRFEAFRKVVLPLSFPGVFAAVILTFVPATGDYVNSTVLGRTDTTMIGNIIQTKFLTAVRLPRGRGALGDPHARHARDRARSTRRCSAPRTRRSRRVRHERRHGRARRRDGAAAAAQPKRSDGPPSSCRCSRSR